MSRQEKMIKYHDYFKAKYNAYLKSKIKSKDKKVRLIVTIYVSPEEKILTQELITSL